MVANAFRDMMPSATRAFGPFELRGLIGKSLATMVWLARDRRSGREAMLTLPREAPVDAAALARWLDGTRHAARLDHPNLAPVLEIGEHDGWPYVAVDRGSRVTLQEWHLAHRAPQPADLAGWIRDALQGLAFAHDGGVAHGDPQLHTLLIDERGTVSAMALGSAATRPEAGARRDLGSRGMAMDPALLRGQRAAAERDVLACGVLLQHLLGGEPALGLADAGAVIARMAPLGTAVVRLPWTTPLPIPDGLRTIANRATAPQERLRYRGARTLLAALGGWLDADARDEGGPVALLLDRLRSVGHLPALPGLAARVARVIAHENQRTEDLANQILPDLALSFELLRTLNTAEVQGTQVLGNGPVLTLRRVVALIGVNGVRRAANALRAWPGALGEEGALRLRKTMERVRLAGHLAQALRPAGYDAEVAFLIAVLQNLGRLLIRYHFADESEQIEQLMRTGTPDGDAAASAHSSGMTEEEATFAVLGAEPALFGHAVAPQWGLGDEIQHMMRRVPADAPVRKPDADADVLRLVASAANETVDVVSRLPAGQIGAALERVAERYGRVLRLSPRILQGGLQGAREALRAASIPARPAPRRRPSPEPTEPAALVE